MFHSAVRGIGSLIKHRPLRSLLPTQFICRSTHSFTKEELQKLSERLAQDYEELSHMEMQLESFPWSYWSYWTLCSPLLAGVAISVFNQHYKMSDMEEGNSKGGLEHDPEEVLPYHDDDPQEVVDRVRVVSASDAAAALVSYTRALECVEDDRLEDAVYHLTNAIVTDPRLCTAYLSRAQALIKLRKPFAAIHDIAIVLEIDPESAEAFRARGKANILLGRWEEAVSDLRQASILYYEQEILSIAEVVDFKAANAREQLRVAEWVRKENKEKVLECEKLCREAESKAKKKSDRTDPSAGFAALLRLVEDPDLMRRLKDPEVVSVIRNVRKYPGRLEQYKLDPKHGPVVSRVMACLDGVQ